MSDMVCGSLSERGDPSPWSIGTSSANSNASTASGSNHILHVGSSSATTLLMMTPANNRKKKENCLQAGSSHVMMSGHLMSPPAIDKKQPPQPNQVVEPLRAALAWHTSLLRVFDDKFVFFEKGSGLAFLFDSGTFPHEVETITFPLTYGFELTYSRFSESFGGGELPVGIPSPGSKKHVEIMSASAALRNIIIIW